MTQTATVKEISVKEGGEGKKAWKNTRITTTEGAVIGTFEAEATKLKEGDEIEFEAELDGKYVNIKKGTLKVLKAAGPLASAGHANGKDQGGYKRDTEGIQFEYNLKAQLQHNERVSIEAQTAYIKIMELASAGTSDLGHATFSALFEKALRWADQRLDAAIQNMPKTPPTAPSNRLSEATAPAGQQAEAARPPAPQAVSGPQASDYSNRLETFFAKALADLGMDVEAVNVVAKKEGVDLNDPATDLRLFWNKVKKATVKA